MNLSNVLNELGNCIIFQILKQRYRYQYGVSWWNNYSEHFRERTHCQLPGLTRSSYPCSSVIVLKSPIQANVHSIPTCRSLAHPKNNNKKKWRKRIKFLLQLISNLPKCRVTGNVNGGTSIELTSPNHFASFAPLLSNRAKRKSLRASGFAWTLYP